MSRDKDVKRVNREEILDIFCMFVSRMIVVVNSADFAQSLLGQESFAKYRSTSRRTGSVWAAAWEWLIVT